MPSSYISPNIYRAHATPKSATPNLDRENRQFVVNHRWLAVKFEMINSVLSVTGLDFSHELPADLFRRHARSPKTSELFCQSVFHVNLSFIEAV
jgi:hypothetical protein